MSPRPIRSYGLLAAAVLIAGISAGAATQEETAGGAPLLVTSSLGATSALLFVVDPGARTLAAYEAVPGDQGGLRLVGARKIEQDLRLTRYRDRSEFSYAELKERYETGESAPEDPQDGR